MKVKASMPVRMNLVVPLAHEATAMRTTETAGPAQAWPGAVTPLIGSRLRPGHLESTSPRSTPTTTRSIRTSTTATRTTTTRTTSCWPAPSADPTVAFSFEDLVDAYVDCRRAKRNSASALAFEAHLERNLCRLHEQLNAGTYRPGRSICFVVTKPKPREVWAADFADRVVHHLLYNQIAPRFHAAFTAANSYLGLLGQASHGHRDKARVAHETRRRGHCINSALTKAFQRPSTTKETR